MKFQLGVTKEAIGGRDDRIADSGLVQLYRDVMDPDDGPRREVDGMPVRALNLSTMPIDGDTKVKVARDGSFHFIIGEIE